MRFRPARRVLIIMSVWLLLAAGYVAGYFLRAHTYDNGTIHRGYWRETERVIWSPLGRIESMIRGRPVKILAVIDVIVQEELDTIHYQPLPDPPDMYSQSNFWVDPNPGPLLDFAPVVPE